MTTTSSDFDRVIGLVGLKASGKDVFSKAMATRIYAEWRISDPIRTEAISRRRAMGMNEEQAKKYTMKELMDVGDDFRRTGGPGYPAELMLGMAKSFGHRRVVVNGIRNPGEIVSLQRIVGDKLILVGITAPFMVRLERASARFQPEDPLTLEAFAENDDRDRGIGQPPHGQQVDRSLAMVAALDPTLIYHNADTLQDYRTWIDSFCTRFAL